VQQHCPSFPKKNWTVTPRQLLAHLGGIRHYRDQQEFDNTKHYSTIKEALEIFKNDPLLHQPGTKFSDITYGYVLLGCVIEGAAGMTYREYVLQNTFRPAGMNRTQPDDVWAIISGRSRGYRRLDNEELRNAQFADSRSPLPVVLALAEAAQVLRGVRRWWKPALH
jgi:CubicO group peptidase (beta-lactamase class C family)